jgi:predicted RNA-binding Zn-ribbon protein involved in translation (DUF1610 family)
MDNKENNNLNSNKQEELIVIICNKCNNVIQGFKELENFICDNCGNIITNLQQVDIKKIEENNIISKENKIKIINQNYINDKKLIIDPKKKNNFFYLANIIIFQNFKEIIFINFAFSLNIINLLMFLFIGGYLVFWIYKYITLNAYLNQVIIFLIIFLFLGAILYVFAIFYNSIFYKLSEKLFLILGNDNIGKNELKLINKSLLNFENLKNFFYAGFRVFLLSSRINFKYFVLYLLISVLLFFALQYIINKAIYNEDFYFGFCGILLVFNLFFLVYNNLIKQLVILFDVKNKVLNNKEINYKDLVIFINNFLKKNKIKILLFALVFSIIYYLLIPFIQFLLILTGIGFLFIYLPLILLDTYFISFLTVLIFLEDRD